MNKLIISLSLLAVSFNTFACGGDVHMSIPHIHDEEELLISSKNAPESELKHIDIYQIFAGQLDTHHHETATHEEENDAD